MNIAVSAEPQVTVARMGNIDRRLAEYFEQQQHVVVRGTVSMFTEVTVGAR